VAIGVNEFRIAATPLSILVWAKAKKKDGKKVPINPVTVIHFYCSFVRPFNEENPINNKIAVEIKMRMDPNCNGLNPIKLFLIRMYELPQIRVKTTK